MQIVLLPWLQLDHAVSVGGITVLSRNAAIAEAGSYGDAVAKATSYFLESSRRRRPRGATLEYVQVEPSVVILEDGEAALERAHVALDGLFFATMLDVQPRRYANATNFTRMSVSNLSPSSSGFWRPNRTLFGSSGTATQPDYSVEVRPHWCAEKTPAANAGALLLYEAAIGHAEFDAITRAIGSLYEAMSDAPNIPARFEFEDYARALERLLHRNGQTINTRRGDQDALVRALLEPHIAKLNTTPNLPDNPSGEEVARATMEAKSLTLDGVFDTMYRIREDRNETIHPDGKARKSLHDQPILRPNLLAFRVVSALLLATLAKFAPAAWTQQLRAYVAATVEWTSEYDRLKTMSAEEAIGRFGDLLSFNFIRMRDGAGV